MGALPGSIVLGEAQALDATHPRGSWLLRTDLAARLTTGLEAHPVTSFMARATTGLVAHSMYPRVHILSCAPTAEPPIGGETQNTNIDLPAHRAGMLHVHPPCRARKTTRLALQHHPQGRLLRTSQDKPPSNLAVWRRQRSNQG